MPHQLGEEFTVGLAEHVVISDAAADEDLLHPRHRPDFPQQGQVVGMAGIQIFAGCGSQTGAIFAHAVLHLLSAAGVAEVGRRTAHVVDIPLEQGISGEALHLPHHALVAAGSNHPSLVEGQRAEIASPEAPPVVGHGEAHLLNSGHAAQRVIHGVDLPGIGQLRYEVQLLPAQGNGRRVHHQGLATVGLEEGPAPDGIMLLVFNLGSQGVVPFIGADSLIGGN